MLNYKEKDLILFQDSVGHLSVAEFASEDDTFVKVKNPLYITTVQTKEGGSKIVFPEWCHKGFFADINQDKIWNVAKSQYSFLDVCAYDIQLTSIYRQTVAPITKEDVVTDKSEIAQPAKKKSSVDLYDTK
jgi:hypothetical protein